MAKLTRDFDLNEEIIKIDDVFDTFYTKEEVYTQEEVDTIITDDVLPEINACIKNIKIGTVSNGTDAAVTASTANRETTLDFTFPNGDKGDKGDTGSAGAMPTTPPDEFPTLILFDEEGRTKGNPLSIGWYRVVVKGGGGGGGGMGSSVSPGVAGTAGENSSFIINGVGINIVAYGGTGGTSGGTGGIGGRGGRNNINNDFGGGGAGGAGGAGGGNSSFNGGSGGSGIGDSSNGGKGNIINGGGSGGGGGAGGGVDFKFYLWNDKCIGIITQGTAGIGGTSGSNVDITGSNGTAGSVALYKA